MKQKKIYPTKKWIISFAQVFLSFFIKRYNIIGIVPEEVKQLKAPYILLGNHVGFWDPFIVDQFLPDIAHYVASDAAFRSSFNRFFITRAGTIPKKKNVRDSKVIRDMIGVIRQGENIGLFPEAVRNYAGYTFPIDPSIAKLVKSLNVPVIIAKLQGMNNFNPRWSSHLRKTKVEIDYKLLFESGELKQLDLDEIYKRLVEALDHDEVTYQSEKMHKIHSTQKAEHISYALYICPHCHGIDTFRCKGNEFSCESCQYDILINEYGFFDRVSDGELYFNNIRDWYKWQEPWLINHVKKLLDKKDKDAILIDKDSKLYYSADKGKLKFLDTVDAFLFIDRLELRSTTGKDNLNMNFEELETINPQVKERLEIFYKGDAYRLVGGRPGVSALKWEVAVNAIWRELGYLHKLSPYIKFEE